MLECLTLGVSAESPLSFTPQLDKSRNAAQAMLAILCQRLLNASSNEPSQSYATTFNWDGGRFNSRNIADRREFWTNIRATVAAELHALASDDAVVYLMTSCAPHESTFHVWALPEPIVHESMKTLPTKKSSEVQYNFEISPSKQRIERFSDSPDLTPYYRRLQFTQHEASYLDRARAVDEAVKLERKINPSRSKAHQTSASSFAQVADSVDKATDMSDFLPATIVDARVRAFASIVRRSGQQQFRGRLLKAYGGRCAFSDCTVEAVLDAAHIIPYRGPDTDHTSNGLLLRTDLHTLFDLRLVAVDVTSWHILLAPQLMESCYGDLHGKIINLPSISRLHPNKDALIQHRLETGL